MTRHWRTSDKFGNPQDINCWWLTVFSIRSSNCLHFLRILGIHNIFNWRAFIMYSSTVLPIVASDVENMASTTKVAREKFTARRFGRRRWISARIVAVCGVAACFYMGAFSYLDRKRTIELPEQWTRSQWQVSYQRKMVTSQIVTIRYQ